MGKHDDHAQGQKDCRNDRSDPPYDFAGQVIDFFTPGGGQRAAEGHERNANYYAGHSNHRNQTR